MKFVSVFACLITEHLTNISIVFVDIRQIFLQTEMICDKILPSHKRLCRDYSKLDPASCTAALYYTYNKSALRSSVRVIKFSTIINEL